MEEPLEEFGFDFSKGERPSKELEAWCEDRFRDSKGERLKYVFKAVFRRYGDGGMSVIVHAFLDINGSRRIVTIRDSDGEEHRGVAMADPVGIALDEMPPEEIRVLTRQHHEEFQG